MNEKIKERRKNFLKQTLRDLYKDLEKTPTLQTDDINKISEEIKKLEQEKKDIELKQKIKRTNEKHKAKRKIISLLMEIQFPSEDITTNSCNFHATKLKKVKGLEDFLKLYPYTTAEYDHENKVYKSFKINGNRYQFVKYKYEYGKPEQVIKLNYKEILEYNGIKSKPLSFAVTKKKLQKIFEESQKIEKQIEKYRDKLNKLDVYFLNNEELIYRSSDLHITQYRR